MPLYDRNATHVASPNEARPAQVQIEDAEWADPNNWHGGMLHLYYSKRDTRAFVPKRGTVVGGATINFARVAGILFLGGILLFVALGYALNY